MKAVFLSSYTYPNALKSTIKLYTFNAYNLIPLPFRCPEEEKPAKKGEETIWLHIASNASDWDLNSHLPDSAHVFPSSYAALFNHAAFAHNTFGTHFKLYL